MIEIKKTAKYFTDEIPAISIVSEISTFENGIKIASGKGPRRAFFPGDVAQVAEWVNGCENAQTVIDLCNFMWTPEVIENYVQTYLQND